MIEITAIKQIEDITEYSYIKDVQQLIEFCPCIKDEGIDVQYTFAFEIKNEEYVIEYGTASIVYKDLVLIEFDIPDNFDSDIENEIERWLHENDYSDYEYDCIVAHMESRLEY